MVGPWRLQFDPVARFGVPAHVTVLYPFRIPELIDAATSERVREVARRVRPFVVAFREPAEWPGVVWLRPEPDDPLRELTEAAADTFPDCPPYEGRFDDNVPHLTVGQNLDEEQQQAAVDAMTESLRAEPIRATVRELVLYASDGHGQWARRQGWPLG